MKKEFVEKQKEKLRKEEKDIEKMLSSFAEKDKDIKNNWETNFPKFGSHTSEQDENADEVEEYVNLLPVEHRLELRLLDIKRALEKIKKGKNYGLCERCGKKIKEKRLKVIPETKFCSNCAKQ